nr:hypothetical protein [Tanacetum cinerariifolium]
MDLFSLIRASNPTNVKTESRPRAPHEVPLLTLTAARVIEMDEPAAATDSSGVPSAVEKSPLDFAHEDEASDQGAPADVSDPDPLSFADAPSHHPVNVSHVYRPEWGVTNGSLLDTSEACQDLVDHAAPPGYFFELRHMHNKDFLGQYNINLARQVAMGSKLRLRFEQEAKLLRKSVAQVAHRDQRIQARESEIKNLEALLETKAGMKRAAEEKSAGLSQELERMCAQFSKLQVAFEDYKRQQDQMVEQRSAEMDARLDALSIDFDEELYPHMLTAIAGRRWVIGHGLRLAMMKCAKSLEMRHAFADVVSAGVTKGMSEGLKHGVEHGHAQLTVESLEAYDPEAEAKFAASLQSLKDLNRAEQKKRSHIVCRTHGVGSAHHARSDRVPTESDDA